MTRACAGRPRLDRRGRRGGEQRRAVRSRRALCFLLPLREPHPLVLPPPPLVLFVERAGSRKRPRPSPPPPPSIGPSRSIARRAADRRRSTTRAIATTSMGTISSGSSNEGGWAEGCAGVGFGRGGGIGATIPHSHSPPLRLTHCAGARRGGDGEDSHPATPGGGGGRKLMSFQGAGQYRRAVDIAASSTRLRPSHRRPVRWEMLLVRCFN